MKRYLIIAALLALSALALSACAPEKPANHLEAIKQNGVIKVGTSADYPPFEYVDSSGNMTGFDIDLMNEIGKRIGVKVEWVDMPFDSLIAAVQEGKLDTAISAFNYSAERDETIDFTDPYYTSEDSFMVPADFSGAVVKPEDVVAYKVGVQTGTTQDSWLTDNLVATGQLPEGNLFRYDRVDQAVLDLKSGRIDVLMSDYVPAQALAKQQGGLEIVYHGVLSSGPMNIVIPEGDAALASAINTIIRQLHEQGIIDKLAIQYIGGLE
jgi:polar amino acid transport system substrate-binding protein